MSLIIHPLSFNFFNLNLIFIMPTEAKQIQIKRAQSE